MLIMLCTVAISLVLADYLEMKSLLIQSFLQQSGFCHKRTFYQTMLQVQ